MVYDRIVINLDAGLIMCTCVIIVLVTQTRAYAHGGPHMILRPERTSATHHVLSICGVAPTNRVRPLCQCVWQAAFAWLRPRG